MPNLTTAAGVISLHSVFSSVSFGWWENPSRSGSVHLKNLRIRLPSGPKPRLRTGWVTFRAQCGARGADRRTATPSGDDSHLNTLIYSSLLSSELQLLLSQIRIYPKFLFVDMLEPKGFFFFYHSVNSKILSTVKNNQFLVIYCTEAVLKLLSALWLLFSNLFLF